MLWIALHLPCLSLESFVQTLPVEAHEETHGRSEVSSSPSGGLTRSDRSGGGALNKPLALLDEHRIQAANPAAQAVGVKPGMKRATALALAPAIVFGQADGRRDEQARCAVAQVALRFTPSVSLEASDTVVLEVQASLRLFGGLRPLLQRLQAALQPLDHQIRIATAPTALGAALLAAWRHDLVLGAHTIDSAALAALLSEAPVWLVGRGREHWEALQGMGLKQLGDLRHLPRSGLARRFGPDLLLDLDRAHGDAPDPRTWATLPRRFEMKLELFARADRCEQLLHAAGVLLQRLVAWAQARQVRVAAFTLGMHHETRLHRALQSDASAQADGRDPAVPACTPLTIAPGEASADAAHLHTLLAERLARVELPAPVLELAITCDHVLDQPAPNGELFPSAGSRREGLMRLVDRLQARLGHESLRRLQAVADHRPGHDSREVPLGSAAAAAAASAPVSPSAFPPGGAGLLRPLWTLPKPQPLRDSGAKPVLDGKPLQLLAGPERIETGWWDGDLVTRDYYVAVTATQALVWVYRERLPDPDAAPGWFLHGRFG
jgi:protein ImuB